jgi:tRNA-2-methylthio-N6-dimethylallyladenosine synthase
MNSLTYFFETYGCQMNRAESAAVEQTLLSRGWNASLSPETADLAIINTCSVRVTAETRIYGRLGWYAALKTKHPNLTLAVTGCMAERLLKDFKARYPVIDYVVGNFQKQRFAEIAEVLETGGQVSLGETRNDLAQSAKSPEYIFPPISLEPGASTAFVPIMHGCNNFCTYCIVPYVRGREISRSTASIFAELDHLSACNVREITLLGQNVNSYKWTEDGSDIAFPDLMLAIAEHLKKTNSSIGWVRFVSSHPKDLSDRLIDIIASERSLCRHIHLPCQHGSTKILAAMNRKYTREHYLDTVRKIREKLPDASLSTDILVGFPGETDEDFEQTVSLLREVRFEAAFTYYYNPREGTPAASMADQIPLALKKERLQTIIDMQLAITREEMAKRLGSEATVLAQSVSRDDKKMLLGLTEQNERAVFTAPVSRIGNFVKITLKGLTGNTFRGKII